MLDRHGDPVPLGVVGELAIGGSGVAAGYLGRPAPTAERFVPDPWRSGGRLYRTGDRVRLTAAGLMDFLGRADDQVKIRGFRVELGEVESWLRRQPGVVEAAVLARPVTAGGGVGLRLTAFVALATLDDDALRTAMAATLPDDEAAPPAPSAGRRLTEAEETLAALWAEVLGRPSVGVEEDFFAIGGDSILALQVIAKASLMRVVLARIGTSTHRFLWTWYHALLDGWSMSQLLGEILRRYDGEAVPPPAVRVHDLVAWT
ncbi:AMP-binding protein [Azospirillum sp. A1-3]|nr:AMP-binding protein [Azospirillum sp. A1-3]